MSLNRDRVEVILFCWSIDGQQDLQDDHLNKNVDFHFEKSGALHGGIKYLVDRTIGEFQ